MSLKIVSLINESVVIASLGVTLAPFETRTFVNDTIPADVATLDVLKKVQAELNDEFEVLKGSNAEISALKGIVLGAGNDLTSPQAIAGLTYWFDAQSPVYTAAYAKVCDTLGEAVALWPSAHGSTTAATAVPTGTTPTFDPAGIGGKPAIKFAGNGYFTVANALSTAYNNALTVFIVARGNDISANPVLLSAQPAAGNFWVQAISDGRASFAHSNLSVASGSVQPNAPFNGIITLSVGAASVQEGMSTPTNEIWQAGPGSTGGSQSSLVTAVTGGLNFSGTPILNIGALYGNNNKFDGWIGEVLVYQAALTSAQIGQIRDYLLAKWYGKAAGAITIYGNSLVSGTGSTSGATQPNTITGDNLPGKMWALLGSNYRVITDAYPGRRMDQINTESALFSQTLRQPMSSTRPIAFLWEGTNTLNATQSARATYELLRAFCVARKNAGDYVVIGTIMPVGSAVFAGWEAARVRVNTWIRANYLEFAHRVADFAAEPKFQNVNDTTYFDPDKIHLNSVGYGVAAGIAAAAVRALP